MAKSRPVWVGGARESGTARSRSGCCRRDAAAVLPGARCRCNAVACGARRASVFTGAGRARGVGCRTSGVAAVGRESVGFPRLTTPHCGCGWRRASQASSLQKPPGLGVRKACAVQALNTFRLRVRLFGQRSSRRLLQLREYQTWRRVPVRYGQNTTSALQSQIAASAAMVSCAP